VGGTAVTQAQMDQAWAAWVGQAAREIQETTGAEVEGLGEAYCFQEFDPLEQGRSRGLQPTVAEMFRWCDRRLAEAVAMHRLGNWTAWSGKHSRRVAREFGGEGIPLGHLVEVFAKPWGVGVEQLAGERVRLAALLETYLANRKLLAVTKWRNELNERAESGMREAFRYLRQDDDPDRAICCMGVGQVLEANRAVWAKHWDVCPDAPANVGSPAAGRCTVGSEARAQATGHQVHRIEAETWRAVAASFPGVH
jgi:hypothetical protein